MDLCLKAQRNEAYKTSAYFEQFESTLEVSITYDPKRYDFVQ